MRNTCYSGLVTLSAILFLCSVTNPAENSLDYVVNVGSEQLRSFVAQPELGYVVKSSRNKSAVLSLDSTTQKIQSKDTEYLNVANRPDTRIVLGEQSLIQSERNIRILSNQPDTEYIAPLFTLGGETVAIIPEIIVRLAHESALGKFEELCLELNCTIVRNLLYTDQEFLLSPTAQNAEEVLTTVEVLDSADFIEWAWPNIAFQPKLCGDPPMEYENVRVEPNDVYFYNQWHLDAINAPEAWAYTTGDPNIVIAVLDTGIDVNHPDLIGNIVPGYDFLDDDSDPNPTGDDAHGTACAGLIAAQGDNSIGVIGVAWHCKIMPIRIIGDDLITDVEIADAFRWSAENGADVLSNSWSEMIPGLRPTTHSAIWDVTKPGGIGRQGKGCVVLFASGNGGPMGSPAVYSEVIAVGAIDANDKLWDYSSGGPELDIVAPSGNGDSNGHMWTTDIAGSPGYNNRDPNIYDFTDRMGGTSGACPIVAGVAALILSMDPNLTNLEVKDILLYSARSVGPLGWHPSYGYGCVDAYAAVTGGLNPHPHESIIYVDDNAHNDSGPGDPYNSDLLEDGSEEHPFASIQEAINHSFDGDTVIVMPGIYTGPRNRDIDFWGRMITVRSQEGPESCIIDCEAKGRGFYFHSGEGLNSVVEGFTITNGDGGGMDIRDSSPTVIDCIFTENSARSGGGMNIRDSNSTVTNCTFTRNSARNKGGGMNIEYSNSTVTNCMFTGNSTQEGGGMCVVGGSLAITNCTFTGNSTAVGGGMSCYDGSPTIINCSFTGNSARLYGGGIFNVHCSPTITNCTFIGNSSTDAGGGLENRGLSDTTLINCIVLGNAPDQISDYDNNSRANVSYSNIQGGWDGEGNIDSDPLFVDADTGDYHLRSETGRWNPNGGSWIKDDVTSPCIDAGDPNSDWSGETWPHGGRINMGAYGGTHQASMSSETGGMSLPRVAYIYSHKDEVAESFQSLIETYGCSTTLIKMADVPATPLDSYDLIIVADDTQSISDWDDANSVAAIEDSNKPVIGLGEGGYTFFGELGLSIGYPNGMHGSRDSIEVIDPNCSLFSMPYSIEIPEDRILQLYTETDHVTINLWPIPESVTVLASEVNSYTHYPLVMEHNRYLLWGFTESPQKMTEVGKTLFINVVIWTANKAWESKI